MVSQRGIGVRGRHGKMDLIDGEMMEIRSLSKMGSSSFVVLPKVWLDLVSRQGKVTGIGISFNETTLIIRPYYEVVGK